MSGKHQQVNVCMTIKLRDFAAFEDLANELGYQLSLHSLTESAPTRKRVKRRAGKVTPAMVAEAKALFKAHPSKTTHMLWTKSKLPIGESTFGKILAGYYDNI